MSLVVDNLTKRYGAQAVVDAVGFTVPAGALTGVIGPNGAGKSTLFSLITGFIAADAGMVRLNGVDLQPLASHDRARHGLVRTFQVPREYMHLTVRENLMAAAPDQAGESLARVFLTPRAVARQEDEVKARAEAVIARLRLGGVASLPAGGLSGGQKKLLELGRALMTGARLILLDEPFAGVNPVLIAEIGEQIHGLNAEGIGFLIIEHDLGALSKLVSTLHVMDRGRLIASGAPADVLAAPHVRDAYLGGTA